MSVVSCFSYERSIASIRSALTKRATLREKVRNSQHCRLRNLVTGIIEMRWLEIVSALSSGIDIIERFFPAPMRASENSNCDRWVVTSVLNRLQTRHALFIYMQRTYVHTYIHLLYAKACRLRHTITMVPRRSLWKRGRWESREERRAQASNGWKSRKPVLLRDDAARVGSKTHFDHLISSHSGGLEQARRKLRRATLSLNHRVPAKNPPMIPL